MRTVRVGQSNLRPTDGIITLSLARTACVCEGPPSHGHCCKGAWPGVIAGDIEALTAAFECQPNATVGVGMKNQSLA